MIPGGRAAHITAASMNGPRFDPSLTDTQRKDISNGIWLCIAHSYEVDDDASRHTVEELKDWKATAEARALEVLGRPAFLPVGTPSAESVTKTESNVLDRARRESKLGSSGVLDEVLIQMSPHTSYSYADLGAILEASIGFYLDPQPPAIAALSPHQAQWLRAAAGTIVHKLKFPLNIDRLVGNHARYLEREEDLTSAIERACEIEREAGNWHLCLSRSGQPLVEWISRELPLPIPRRVSLRNALCNRGGSTRVVRRVSHRIQYRTSAPIAGLPYPSGVQTTVAGQAVTRPRSLTLRLD